MKYRVRIDQDKLSQLKEQLQPSKSWWSLVGIVFFFFVPEIVAYFYGDSIVKYFTSLQNSTTNAALKYIYKTLKSLGENSFFNIILGVVFLIWFFKLRFKR
jgi:hypothetical protein